MGAGENKNTGRNRNGAPGTAAETVLEGLEHEPGRVRPGNLPAALPFLLEMQYGELL